MWILIPRDECRGTQCGYCGITLLVPLPQKIAILRSAVFANFDVFFRDRRLFASACKFFLCPTLRTDSFPFKKLEFDSVK